MRTADSQQASVGPSARRDDNESSRRQRLVGWLAVSLATLFASFWAFWGILENFHEGWYRESFAANVAMMIVQYLMPMLISQALTALAQWKPTIGAAGVVVAAVGALWFFRGGAPIVIVPTIVLPLGVLAVLFHVGRAAPRRHALAVVLGVPWLVAVVVGVAPSLRVARRPGLVSHDSLRVATAAGVLVWAPAGPGWSTRPTSWWVADSLARHVAADGRSIDASQLGPWRLPTQEEVLATMQTLRSQALGADGEGPSADKAGPLWDPRSPIVHWWTSDTATPDSARRIAFNGRWRVSHRSTVQGSMGFRAVRRPERESRVDETHAPFRGRHDGRETVALRGTLPSRCVPRAGPTEGAGVLRRRVRRCVATARVG